jgi:hypothetical protein
MALVVLCVAGAVSCDAGSSTAGSRLRLPKEFNRIPVNGATGELLTARSGKLSAIAALTDAITLLAEYFDAPLVVVNAVVAFDGSSAQATFTGQRAKQAVRGLAVARWGDNAAVVTVLFDKSAQFAASFKPLSDAWVSTLPGAEETPLESRRLPDGSGAILLPAGWTLTAQNAMVSAKGAEGSVDLGINVQAYTPEVAATMMFQPPVVMPFGDPASDYRRMLTIAYGLQAQAVQIVERAPAPGWTSGPGASLHFKITERGERTEGIAMVLTQMVGPGTFMYYSSGVAAPEASFAKNLPMLMKVWSSWKVDDRVFQERLRTAAESLRQVGQIIRDVANNQRDAMDRSSRAWDHHIRDTWTFEDTSTGKRRDGPADSTALLEAMNRAEGYNRYRAITYEELNKRLP